MSSLTATLTRKDNINPQNMKEGITDNIGFPWKWSVLDQRWCHVWSPKKLPQRIFLSVHACKLCVGAYSCREKKMQKNETTADTSTCLDQSQRLANTLIFTSTVLQREGYVTSQKTKEHISEKQGNQSRKNRPV